MSNGTKPPVNPYQAPATVSMTPATPAPAKPKKAPIPAWAWLFAIACAAIPVMTLGGAIPGAVGLGGAAGCVTLARDADKPIAVRIGGCIAITVVCYAIFGALLMATFAVRG